MINKKCTHKSWSLLVVLNSRCTHAICECDKCKEWHYLSTEGTLIVEDNDGKKH